MDIEFRFLNGIIKNPDILEKTSITNKMLDNYSAKMIYGKIQYDFSKEGNVNFLCKDYIINILNKKSDDWFDGDIDTYEDLLFNSLEEDEELDWKYVQLLLEKEYKRRTVINSLTKSIEKLDSGSEIDTVMTNLENDTKFLSDERVAQVTNALEFSEIYDALTEEMNELSKNGKPSHYTLHLFEAIKNTTRMKKGWLWTLVGSSGGGKTIIMAQLLVDFVKKYKERALFITDENSKEVILTYMYCAYFGLKYYDVEDRKVDITKFINELDEKNKKEYQEIFGLIDVEELPCIPMEEVRKMLKTAKNNNHPYSWVSIDSFEEIDMDSSEGISEIDRYDRNAKSCERLAKDMDIILGVTSQLKTDFYTISIDKMPMLCNHQSKTLIKKCFMALLLHNEYANEGKGENKTTKSLGFRCRTLKCRSGGQDAMFAIDKDFDHCKCIPSKVLLNKEVEITTDF